MSGRFSSGNRTITQGAQLARIQAGQGIGNSHGTHALGGLRGIQPGRQDHCVDAVLMSTRGGPEGRQKGTPLGRYGSIVAYECQRELVQLHNLDFGLGGTL
jgi:hypothetical protein